MQCYSACFLLWDDKKGVGGEDGVSANSMKLCWLSEVSDVYVSRSIWVFASCQIIFLNQGAWGPSHKQKQDISLPPEDDYQF